MLSKNWEQNKKKIWFYIGSIIVLILKALGQFLIEIIDISSPFGNFLATTIDYLMLGIIFIAPLIFGRDPDLDRVKGERNKFANNLQKANVENEGLRITNVVQGQIRKELGHDPLLYDDVKAEVEKEKMKKKLEEI